MDEPVTRRQKIAWTCTYCSAWGWAHSRTAGRDALAVHIGAAHNSVPWIESDDDE
jgi:hypothetical protein